MPVGTAPEQMLVMLQNFLIERFKIRTHHQNLIARRKGPRSSTPCPLACLAGKPDEKGIEHH
jgi:hypothetical protein